MTREVRECHVGHVLMLPGAVKPQQGGAGSQVQEVWRKEAGQQPVSVKGLIELLTQKHRADYP